MEGCERQAEAGIGYSSEPRALVIGPSYSDGRGCINLRATPPSDEGITRDGNTGDAPSVPINLPASWIITGVTPGTAPAHDSLED